MDVDRAVAHLMARQHGVISREQALEAGLTEYQVRGRVERGVWDRLAPGVYTAPGAPSNWEQRLQATLLVEPGALVAGLSAAHLHGYNGIGKTKPEVLAPYGRNHRSGLARIIRSRHFESVSSVELSGFPCTSYAETLLTLSMRLPSQAIERHLDNGLASRRVTISDFDPILDRLAFARQRGLASLKRLVELRSDMSYQPPTTELERLLYRLLDHEQIPPYDRQLPMKYEAANAMVDAYIPLWRLIVEGDGRRWHTRQADFARDRQRDNAAVAAGHAVIRFTWQMLKYEPDNCLRTLLRSGERRLAG